MTLARALWRRWSVYWIAPGGQRSAAVVRIAVAISLLWALQRIAGHAARADSARYFARGIWLLWPERPAATLLAALMPIAQLATIAMLVGFRTRIAHALSFVATLALATHEVSGMPTWTHQHVPPLLASLALLGARTGDALSIDAWLARRRGAAIVPPPSGYQWSVRGAQLAVASVFFVAGVCKLYQGGWTLGWALSDNLRHQLLVRFDWIGLPRTPAADWLLVDVWRYRTVACLNLASQLAPIAAVFCMRRPRIRALLGAVWICEVLGLGVVMALWDTHWLPLAAVFVDWDALGRRRTVEIVDAAAPSSRYAVALISTVLAFGALQSFALNQRLQLYPFSSYPMFATVRAQRPYLEHLPYELPGGRIEVDATPPTTPAMQAWIDRRIQFRWMWTEHDRAAIARNLEAILRETQARWPDHEFHAARIILTVDHVDAYPAQARLERRDVRVLGELRRAREDATARAPSRDGAHPRRSPRRRHSSSRRAAPRRDVASGGSRRPDRP